jgi:acetyl-CoA carboxylase biotin carboxylase subunit
MEMNTRIQVEHPITEEVTDCDLVENQIQVAMGETVEPRDIEMDGHAIECRINAENPRKKFTPSPGTITAFHQPGGQGVRVDTHAYASYVIPPTYDSMIGKLIVRAKTREQAINKMKRALDEFVIEGIHTTIPFHQQLMDNPKFRAGDFDTRFLDNFKMDAPAPEEV